jgi:hypothetical protein
MTPVGPHGRCGCHEGCHTDPHPCDVPCRWPSCLTEEEAAALAGEIWPQEERDSYWDGWL